MKKFWQILERNQLCKCICSGFLFSFISSDVSYFFFLLFYFFLGIVAVFVETQFSYYLEFYFIFSAFFKATHTQSKCTIKIRFLLLIERKLEFLRGWRVWHYVHRRHSGNLNPKTVIYIQCFKYCGVYTASLYFLGVQKLYDL